VINARGEKIAFERSDLYQGIDAAIPGGFEALDDSVRPLS
jgi:hypothetical protein